jgi:hypothetical protein
MSTFGSFVTLVPAGKMRMRMKLRSRYSRYFSALYLVNPTLAATEE